MRPSIPSLLVSALVLSVQGRGQVTLQLHGESSGSSVTVEGRTGGPDGPSPLFQATWRGVPEGGAVFQIQRTLAPDEGDRLMLDRLLEAGIGAYLDARVHFTKQGVVSDLPAAQLVADIDAMVKAAAEDLGATGSFSGLSEPTRMQLSRLTHIDWSKAHYGVDAGDEQDKYLAIYQYVRSQREELERQLRADLLPLAGVAVLGAGLTARDAQVRINSTCGTVFDEENYLCALDLQLADTGGGIDPRIAEQLLDQLERNRDTIPSESQVMMPARPRKRDRWLKAELDGINERIDRLDQRRELWAIRDRVEDIEDRLMGLEMEVRSTRTSVAAGDNPSAALSDLVGRNITVRFASGSPRLDAGNRVLLNEVFEQLVRNPDHRVLITGYSDRTGDQATNLQLSEKRARAVRGYLLQRGIDADRLMVNFYGDSRSLGIDPEERRVEVEWIH